MNEDARQLEMSRVSNARNVFAAGYGRRLVKRRASRAATIEAFLTNWAGKLGIDKKELTKNPREEFTSSLGAHVLFQQKVQGRLISRAWLRIDVDTDGNVIGFSNRYLPNTAAIEGSPRSPTLNAKEALACAATAFDLNNSLKQARSRAEVAKKRVTRRPRLIDDPKLVFCRFQNAAIACWKIPCEVRSPREKANIYVNSDNGEVIVVESLANFRSGRGRVFIPNPMVALNDISLSVVAPVPAQAYQEVELLDLDGTGYLSGTFVTTRETPTRIRVTDLDFRMLGSGSKGYSEVMSYYHIDSAQRYIRRRVASSRFPAIVAVNARTKVYAESAFDFGTNILHLYDEGPRDGDDAEIIIHEFGHALHHAISPGFGRSGYSRLISEGFADYFAATCLGGTKPRAFENGIASWHARGMGNTDAPPFLRRLDYAGKFRANSLRLIEVWSSCLWELRTLFGPHRADALALLALHLYDPHLNSLDSFYDAALAVRQVNSRVYGNGTSEVEDLFRRHGIFQ